MPRARRGWPGGVSCASCARGFDPAGARSGCRGGGGGRNGGAGAWDLARVVSTMWGGGGPAQVLVQGMVGVSGPHLLSVAGRSRPRCWRGLWGWPVPGPQLWRGWGCRWGHSRAPGQGSLPQAPQAARWAGQGRRGLPVEAEGRWGHPGPCVAGDSRRGWGPMESEVDPSAGAGRVSVSQGHRQKDSPTLWLDGCSQGQPLCGQLRPGMSPTRRIRWLG